MAYVTVDDVEVILAIPFTSVQSEAMEVFLNDWAIQFNTLCYLSGVNPSELSDIALENVEMDCRNNAKDWYWTIGRDLSVNYTTLSSEGYSEAYSNRSRDNSDFFKLSYTTRVVCGIAAGIFSIRTKTNWGV